MSQFSHSAVFGPNKSVTVFYGVCFTRFDAKKEEVCLWVLLRSKLNI